MATFDRNRHGLVIDKLLAYLNRQQNNPYVLKGGTSLMKCYGLDRFSEDVDLDAAGSTTERGRFISAVEQFCKENDYEYRLAKDTETTGRIYVNYGDAGNPLKVEVSYRKKEIPESEIAWIKGTKVYTLDEIAQMKAAAYMARDKVRDLYDVSFICSEHFDELGDSTKKSLQRALEYKDLDQFDYLMRTQDDPLIDKDLLETRFLQSFSKLGLLTPERKESEEYGKTVVEQKTSRPGLAETVRRATLASQQLGKGNLARGKDFSR